MSNDGDQEGKNLPDWLSWAREIQAISQTGIHFAENDYQRQRFHRLSEISAEIFATYSNIDYPLLIEKFNQQIGYATPRVDVRGAVFQDGKLLLVKERMDGSWTMPGGWADVGDIPSSAVEREVHEEAGLVVRAKRIVGVYDANRIGPLEVFHAYKIVFQCDILGGEPRPGDETSQVAFFSQKEIPDMLSGERTKTHHVHDAFKALNRDLPALFD
jgi:ADP-ribose pyrophosphatase YjhB (NUDIX family)